MDEAFGVGSWESNVSNKSFGVSSLGAYKSKPSSLPKQLLPDAGPFIFGYEQTQTILEYVNDTLGAFSSKGAGVTKGGWKDLVSESDGSSAIFSGFEIHFFRRATTKLCVLGPVC